MPAIIQFIRALFQSLSKSGKTIIHTPGWMILVIPLLCAIYYAIRQPVTYDEAWAYLRFTPSPPLVSLRMYPAAHNHLFYSLVSCVMHLLPFMPALILFRIPSIAVSMLSWCILFHSVRKWNGDNPALLVTAITSMLFMSIYYSYIGSEYSWVVFFFLLAAISVWQLIRRQQQEQYAPLYAVSCVMGCFTMPAFALVVIACAIMLFVAPSLPKKRWFYLHLCIGLVVLLLYAPLIIANGFDEFVARQWVSLLPYHLYSTKITSFWYQTLSEITGLLGALLLLFIIIALVFLSVHKNWRLLGMLLAFFLIPTVALWMQSVVALPQTFIYYGCVMAFIIVLPHFGWLSKLNTKWVLITAILVQAMFWIFFHQRMTKLDGVYDEFKSVTLQILADGKRYFISSDLYAPTFLFEIKRRDQFSPHVVQRIPDPENPVSADTIAGYDYIILDNAIDQTQQRQALYKGDRITVYE